MLSGQTSLLTAVIIEAGRVRRIPNATFKQLMATDGALSEALLGAFRARRRLLMAAADRTIEIVGDEGSGAIAGAPPVRRADGAAAPLDGRRNRRRAARCCRAPGTGRRDLRW